MIKQIFSDMDGTLLNDQGDISAENVKAIKETNLPLTLVSARAPVEMVDVMDKLNLTAPQIGFNGGLIFEKQNDQFKIISQKTIKSDIAKTVVEKIRHNFPQVSLSWYTLNNWYTENIDAGIKLEQSYTSLIPTIVKSADYFKRDQTIFKLMMILFDKPAMADLKQYLLAQNFSGVSIQQSSDNYLEITSDEAQKSRGIQYIIDREKLSANELMAFGDGHNDLPMLEMVDYPVVMDNALPEVREVAKFITKSNQENGVSYALKHFLPTIGS